MSLKDSWSMIQELVPILCDYAVTEEQVFTCDYDSLRYEDNQAPARG